MARSPLSVGPTTTNTTNSNRNSLNYAFEDKEMCGWLYKRNRTGFKQARFVATDKSQLSYWGDQQAFTKRLPPSQTFDIKEIRTVEKTGPRAFVLFFMNAKFKLELTASSDEGFREWFGFLVAKKELYNVDTLLAVLSQVDMNAVQTQVFRSMLGLPDRQQLRWIDDRMSDRFDAELGDEYSKQHHVLVAAYHVTDDFIAVCEDCAIELQHNRNPKIVAHCRSFIKRYADLVRGRLTLELSQFVEFGVGKRRLSEMGERSLCLAIGWSHRLEALRAFAFVPKDLIPQLNAMIFSTGELMSALLNLAIERSTVWFANYRGALANQRHARLMDVVSIWSNSLMLIDLNIGNDPTQQLVVTKVLTAQVLTFADDLNMYSSELEAAVDPTVDETCLSNHIGACHYIMTQFDNMRIVLPCGPLVLGSELQEQHGGAESIKVSADVVDAVQSACLISIRAAMQAVMHKMTSTLSDVCESLFDEKVAGWLGGQTCRLLLSRSSQWLLAFIEAVPSAYAQQTRSRLCNGVTLAFLRQLLKTEARNRQHGVKYSKHGIIQLGLDFEAVHAWVLATSHCQVKENEPQNEREGLRESDETRLLVAMRNFLFAPQTALVAAYIEHLHFFGISHALHLYDLLRFVLKLRVDMDKSERAPVLGIVTEFITQLQHAVAADGKLMVGTRQSTRHVCILSQLLPFVGSEHCTGSKWRMESLADASAVRVMVMSMVSDACALSRKHNTLEEAPTYVTAKAVVLIQQMPPHDASTVAAPEKPPPKPSRRRSAEPVDSAAICKALDTTAAADLPSKVAIVPNDGEISSAHSNIASNYHNSSDNNSSNNTNRSNLDMSRDFDTAPLSLSEMNEEGSQDVNPIASEIKRLYVSRRSPVAPPPLPKLSTVASSPTSSSEPTANLVSIVEHVSMVTSEPTVLEYVSVDCDPPLDNLEITNEQEVSPRDPEVMACVNDLNRELNSGDFFETGGVVEVLAVASHVPDFDSDSGTDSDSEPEPKSDSAPGETYVNGGDLDAECSHLEDSVEPVRQCDESSFTVSVPLAPDPIDTAADAASFSSNQNHKDCSDPKDAASAGVEPASAEVQSVPLNETPPTTDKEVVSQCDSEPLAENKSSIASTRPPPPPKPMKKPPPQLSTLTGAKSLSSLPTEHSIDVVVTVPNGEQLSDEDALKILLKRAQSSTLT